MMTIIEGRDLIYDTDLYDVVLVGTNIENKLSQGFQRKMRRRYPYIEEANMSTPYGDLRKLGKMMIVEGEPEICLCYIAKHKRKGTKFLDVEAVRTCMKRVNEIYKGKKVASTILGHSEFEGEGDKDELLSIMEENSSDIDLYVYDFLQMKREVEFGKCIKYVKNNEMKGMDFSDARVRRQAKRKAIKYRMDLYL